MKSSKKTQKKERGLNIIIVGCGKVGSTLVEKLSKESHDITVIDQKNEVIQRITEDYDVMGFTGNGASYSIQIEAGIQDADVLAFLAPLPEVKAAGEDESEEEEESVTCFERVGLSP